MSTLADDQLHNISTSLLKASIQKRYNRAVLLTYIGLISVTLLCTFGFYKTQKRNLMHQHQALIEADVQVIDNQLQRALNFLSLFNDAAVESFTTEDNFNPYHWEHVEHNETFVLLAKMQTKAPLNQYGHIIGLTPWQDTPDFKRHLGMATHVTESFTALVSHLPNIRSIMLITPYSISYYPQQPEAELRRTAAYIKDQHAHNQKHNKIYESRVWSIHFNEDRATLCRDIIVHGQKKGLLTIEVDLSKPLQHLNQDLSLIGSGVFLNSEKKPLWNWGQSFNNKIDHQLTQSLNQRDNFYKHIDTLFEHYEIYISPFKFMPWQFLALEEHTHLFNILLPELILIGSIIFLLFFILLSLTHFLMRKTFITPANRLLTHLETCAQLPVSPPMYVSAEWEPWFKLVTQTFNQHQKYTIHLSNQNKRLDKIVAQRTKKLKEINLRREREYAQLRALIDSIPDAIFFKDTEGRYLGCNKTAEQMLDMRESQIIGVLSTDFMDEEKARKVALEDEYILANHTSCRYLDKIQVRSRHICLDISKFPFYDRQGNTLGLISMWRDVTSEHDATEQLRLSEERYHLAMDAVEDGVWDWYIGSEQVACNPALYTMLDYKTHDFDCSRSWIFSLIHPEDVVEQQRKIQYLFKNPHTDFESEFRMRCKNGHYIWVLSRGRIVEFTKHGRPKRVVGTNKDITRQKENEEALVEAKKEAEEASLSKSQFLANMSHEIRTPMNAFIGMLQLLRNTELTAQQQDYISKAYNSSHILLNIINDILDVSKIEAGKLNLEHAPFSMRDVIEHAIELTVLPAHKKNIEILLHLDIPTQLTCFGDSLRLSQILINLLANAVKFTETGEVELGCQQIACSGRSIKLKFWVQDTGIGLSDTQQKMLFEAFTQADGSMTRRFGGTGLGLSICKHLIQLMGGRIQVNSALQQGALFSFELGFELEQDAVDSSIEQPVYPSNLYSDKVALIIDDNQKGLTHYSNYLKQLGFVTTTVTNLNEFFDQARAIQPDLLVADHSMQEIQDHQWIQPMLDLLAHDTQIKPTHLLLMTHYNSKINPANYAGFNAFSCLQKPFDSFKLSQTLEPLFVHEQEQHVNTHHQPIFSEQIQHKLLLVEDNIINQQVASELLRSSGYTVDIADNGLIALDCIQKEDYALILMDLQMPEMDGFTATQEIRKHYSAQQLPIIAMTAHAMETDRDKSKSIGMNDYVTKPFVLEQLLQTLNKWIESS